jgi:hypothetical protein
MLSSLSQLIVGRADPARDVVFTMDNPPISDRGAMYIGVDTTMLVLALSWTAMRIYVKRTRSQPMFLAEDIFCYFATLLYFVAVACHYVCECSLTPPRKANWPLSKR